MQLVTLTKRGWALGKKRLAKRSRYRCRRIKLPTAYSVRQRCEVHRLGAIGRSFLVGADTTEQAEAVAQQCLHFLADPACNRVGIVSAGPGALARLGRKRTRSIGHPALRRSGTFSAGNFRGG
jgi:hypothetical protein